ncbi:ASC1-like protein isoform X2 [Cicer arietinum]|uniref:ASC1-like protein 1 isoform X2 n=1 Tax=Cicer arietinum TaxID=3827 RepID=A0A3Q7YE00_CICAR|nr:ASC1-like protein 1 isoform X2 [Cicer arietinum]
MDWIQRFKSIDFHHESFPAYEDFYLLPFFALFFPSIRFLLDRFLFEKVARRMIFGKGDTMLDYQTDDRRKRINKFKESAWKCIYYLSAEVLALSVTYDEPWFTNTRYFWVGPGSQLWPDQKIKLKLKALYMYAAGFYSYSIFALIFWETRRSDFGVSMSHHVATVILIVLSYICSYEVLLTLDKEKHQVDGPLYYYMFNSLLYCLLVLHIYWWVLIYRMLVKQIQARGKLSEDVRSDSDSESEDEHQD